VSDPVKSLPPLREIIAAHGLRAEKKLGQNFLLDLNITDKIAAAVRPESNMSVIEIGPGPGGLTRSLLRAGAGAVIAVEFDPRAVQALQSLIEAAQGRLTIMQGDALETDICALAPAPRCIAANLPYNIAVPLLTGWLGDLRREPGAYAHMTLMFQKEVAMRIVAPPGSKTYGRLSVLAQWLCTVEALFDLPPSVFTPAPKVTSTVVRFTPRTLPPESQADFKTLEHITALAFGQRRKMLRSSLKPYAYSFEAAGIDPQSRAEELPPARYIAMAMLAKKDLSARSEK
jgi:16S rRNA (adenine1518-N6/adenine1519-N6)-dimethyltransferase